ncbi:hypothetical protein ACHAXR_010590 [Thalassiosira sp. AJA248-18]
MVRSGDEGRSGLQEPSPLQGYDLSHIVQYLNQIEECIQSSTTPSPAIKYHHCYDSEDNNSFFKVAGSVLAKPMLRTLIYGGDNVGVTPHAINRKIYFDQRIREARVQIEGQRMFSFAFNLLRPAALSLDAGERDEKIPELLVQIDVIKNRFREDNAQSPVMGMTGTKALFSHIASGRRYKGKLESLISDVFPELLDHYHAASQKATEREVLEFVIKMDLVDENKANACEEWTEKRIKAAFDCLDKFYPVEGYSEKQEPGDGIRCGKECEDSCIAFLQSKYSGFGQKHKILHSVFVNARRSTQNKYVPPKTFKRGSSQKKESGIIWTELFRKNECSEFDAIVLSSGISDAANGLESNSTFVESIWEAKKTISPSTLHDILSKKLGAIEALIDDDGAELVYKDSEDNDVSIPFFSQDMRFTFGIYGRELQRPENAADSIRSIAGSNVVSSNVEEVIRSLERSKIGDNSDVLVEVKLADALKIVQGLKSVIEKIDQNRVDVLLFIEDDIQLL